MRKGVSEIVAAIMVTLIGVTLSSLAVGWFNQNMGNVLNGGLYGNTTSFCGANCTIDPNTVSNILLTLDKDTNVSVKVINNGGSSNSYAIFYYPNFTPEISMIAASPIITVQPGSTGLENLTLHGLILKNNNVNLNITMVNVDNNQDNVSFGIISLINNSNVPELTPLWFFLIMFTTLFSVYLRLE